MFNKALAVLAICAAHALIMSAPAQASDLTWTVSNSYHRTILLRFYGEDNRLWPNSSEAYELSSGESHTYSLSCYSGETVCFGASTRRGRHYWGVGLDNEYSSCSNGDDCCYVCNGAELSNNLTD